jgi:CO/xanthine dehydrogenase Mo-binding subunit
MITGIRAHRIVVNNRRVGGGFGSKITRNLQYVALACVGAVVTGRQVHVQLDRCQDMMMVCVLLHRASTRLSLLPHCSAAPPASWRVLAGRSCPA